MIRQAIVIGALAILSGAALAGDLPPVSAAFHSEMQTIERAGSTSTKAFEWTFDRSKDVVAVEDPQRQVTERWQRDERGRVWFSRSFHQYKRVLEYAPADLSLGGITQGWGEIESVIDPRAVASLLLTDDEKEVLGRTASVYRGTQNGEQIEVWWLPEESLPAFVTRSNGKQIATLRLVSLNARSADAPAPKQSTAEYEIIDFSDVGDRHGDPFIEALLKQEPTWFGHGH